MKTYSWFRLLQYTGDRAWLDKQIANRGVKGSYRIGSNVIAEAFIGDVPQEIGAHLSRFEFSKPVNGIIRDWSQIDGNISGSIAYALGTVLTTTSAVIQIIPCGSFCIAETQNSIYILVEPTPLLASKEPGT